MASDEAIMILIYFSEAIFLLRRPYLLQNIRSSSNGLYFCDSPLTAIDSTTIYYITLYNNNKNSVNKQHILLLPLIRSSALHPRSFDTPHSMTCIFLRRFNLASPVHICMFACVSANLANWISPTSSDWIDLKFFTHNVNPMAIRETGYILEVQPGSSP